MRGEERTGAQPLVDIGPGLRASGRESAAPLLAVMRLQ